jgi:hypothetical protein
MWIPSTKSLHLLQFTRLKTAQSNLHFVFIAICKNYEHICRKSLHSTENIVSFKAVLSACKLARMPVYCVQCTTSTGRLDPIQGKLSASTWPICGSASQWTRAVLRDWPAVASRLSLEAFCSLIIILKLWGSLVLTQPGNGRCVIIR